MSLQRSTFIHSSHCGLNHVRGCMVGIRMGTWVSGTYLSFCWRSTLECSVSCHCFLSPHSSWKRRWQLLRLCQSIISFSLALKNSMSKCTASMGFKNRRCFVKCSPRRWAVFHNPILFKRVENPTAPTPGWLSEQKEKQVYKLPAIAGDWKARQLWRWGKKPFHQNENEASQCAFYSKFLPLPRRL